MCYYKPDPRSELDRAWLNFLDAIGKELHIYKLLDWLTKLLEGNKDESI